MPTLKDRVANASLTPKQLQVLDLLERRLTIAEIAYNLGVSESAINQRIKVLKLRLGANSHRGLVERFLDSDDLTCRIPTGRNPQLSQMDEAVEAGERNDQGSVFRFGDSLSFPREEPWIQAHEPKVVPRALDGENAGGLRLVTIISIVVGIFVAVIVALAAARAVTELF